MNKLESPTGVRCSAWLDHTEMVVRIRKSLSESTMSRLRWNWQRLGWRTLHAVTLGLGEGIIYPNVADWWAIERPRYIAERQSPLAALERLAATGQTQPGKPVDCPK